MKPKYLVSLILFFALSACGYQVEYIEYAEHIEYHEEVTPVYTYTVSEIEVPDNSLPMLQEVVYRDGLIHILDNEGGRGLLNNNGDIIVTPTQGITFGRYGEGRIAARINRRVGFKDTSTGEWAVPPDFIFDSAFSTIPEFFSDGLAVLFLNGSRRGIINKEGEWIVEPMPSGWGLHRQFHRGLNIVHWLPYQDSAGNWVLRPDDVDPRTFVVNTAMERVFPLEHMDIYHHDGWISINIESYNLIRVEIGNYIKFFDFEGNKLSSFEYNDEFFHTSIFLQGDMAIVYNTNVLCQTPVDNTMEFRIFDMQGNEISNRYYTNIGRFREGFAPVEIGRADWSLGEDDDWIDIFNWDNVFWGLIDKQGNEVIPPIHWHVSNVVNGLVQVYSSNGFALLNTAGEYVIPFGEFEGIFVSNHDVVVVSSGCIGTPPSNQLIGLVDLEGNEIISPRYNIIRSYPVSNRYSWGWGSLLTRAGIYSPSRFGWDESIMHDAVSMSIFVEGRAAVAYAGLWAYIDTNGKEVIPLQFTYAGTFKDGLALVNIGGTRAMPPNERLPWRAYTDASNYSAYGGTWHLIDLYGNIVETFEHKFMKRVSANVFAFSNVVSLSEIEPAVMAPSIHRGGRYTPLWDEYGFIDFAFECIYITFMQMNVEGFEIWVKGD